MKEFKQNQRIFNVKIDYYGVNPLQTKDSLNIHVTEVYFQAWKNQHKNTAIVVTHERDDSGCIIMSHSHGINQKTLFVEEEQAEEYGKAMYYKNATNQLREMKRCELIETDFFDKSIELFPEMFI